jgi:hypothetical protein
MRKSVWFLGMMALLVFSGRAQVRIGDFGYEDYRTYNSNGQYGRFPIVQKPKPQPYGSDSKPQAFSLLSVAHSWFLSSDSLSLFYWGDSLRLLSHGVENPCFGVLLPKTYNYRPDSIFLQMDWRFKSSLRYDSLTLNLEVRDQENRVLGPRKEIPITQASLVTGFFHFLKLENWELPSGTYIYFQLKQPDGRAPFWGDIWIRKMVLRF